MASRARSPRPSATRTRSTLPPKAVAQEAPDHRRGLSVDVDRIVDRRRVVARRLHPMTDLGGGPHETNDVRRHDERGAGRGQRNFRPVDRQPMTPFSPDDALGLAGGFVDRAKYRLLLVTGKRHGSGTIDGDLPALQPRTAGIFFD